MKVLIGNRLPRKSNKCSKKTGSGREAGKEELRKKTKLKKNNAVSIERNLAKSKQSSRWLFIPRYYCRPAQNPCDSTNSQSMEDVNGLEQRAIRVLQSATRLQRAPQRSSPIWHISSNDSATLRDEYAARDEEIPPYRDNFISTSILFLMMNDSLLCFESIVIWFEEKENWGAINKLSCSNVLPKRTNLWAVSHIDDNEYEQMVPALISEGS